jgi:hypothetical protein
MDFQEHTQLHLHMREALIAALHESRPVDPDTLGADRLCPTGCWIHGEGAKRWAGNHAFLGLLETHRIFHQQAGLVANQINGGQWAQAQKSLRHGSSFALALADLAAAFRRMRAAAETLAA